MTSYKENRRRRKALVSQAFHSANPFWRTWKELLLVASLMTVAVLLFFLPAAEKNPEIPAQIGGVAGGLVGGALAFYSMLIYRPRRETAWDRAKEETRKKHGPSKCELVDEEFSKTILGKFDVVWYVLGGALAAGVFFALGATLGIIAGLLAAIITTAAIFLIRRQWRAKEWEKTAAEVEAELEHQVGER